MTKEEIGQAVRLRLQSQELPEALNGITLTVLDNQIYRENGYWRVPIRPSAPPRWIYAYYEVLAEIETELDETDHLNVMLVPLLPQDAIHEEATLAA